MNTNTNTEDDNRENLSLREALRDMRMPPPNAEVIYAVAHSIGFTRLTTTSGYLKAERRDGGAPLRIGFGWASGLALVEEIHATFGDDVRVWPSFDRPALERSANLTSSSR